jgi:hypothetical protein
MEYIRAYETAALSLMGLGRGLGFHSYIANFPGFRASRSRCREHCARVS